MAAYSELGSLVVTRAGRPCSAVYQAEQRFCDDIFEPDSLASSPSYSLASAAAGETFCDPKSENLWFASFRLFMHHCSLRDFVKDSRTIAGEQDILVLKSLAESGESG